MRDSVGVVVIDPRDGRYGADWLICPGGRLVGVLFRDVDAIGGWYSICQLTQKNENI